MNKKMNRHAEQNHYETLGISEGADKEAIRQAYLKKLRQYPPEKAPEAFERIRDAYDLLSKPAARMQSMLEQEQPVEFLTELLAELEIKRAYVGPQKWLMVLKEK